MRSLYERCQTCVKVLGQNSDWFGVEQGVRQVCVMSPCCERSKGNFVGAMKCMEETTEQVLLFANNQMRVAEKNEEVKGNLSMLDEIKRW